MSTLAYDDAFEPVAPVLPVRLRGPGGDEWYQLAALVDTGADLTLVPDVIAERALPVAGTIDVRGVTGEVQRVPLYRADVEVADLRLSALVAGFGPDAIIGRDLLNRLIITLNGPDRSLTIAASR